MARRPTNRGQRKQKLSLQLGVASYISCTQTFTLHKSSLHSYMCSQVFKLPKHNRLTLFLKSALSQNWADLLVNGCLLEILITQVALDAVGDVLIVEPANGELLLHYSVLGHLNGHEYFVHMLQ